jgi:predicted nucleotidyltransferase
MRKVTELAVFGSVLRDGFLADSDIARQTLTMSACAATVIRAQTRTLVLEGTR